MGSAGYGKTPELAQPSMMDLGAFAQSADMYDSTDPIRKQIIGSYADLVSGEKGAMDLPQYQGIEEGLDAAYNTARPQIEDQYGVAKENILANTPRGGGQVKALGDLEMGRADSVSGLGQKIASQRAQSIQQIIQDVIGKSYGMATGAPQISVAGMTGAGGNLASQQNALINMQSQRNSLGPLGSGGKMGKGSEGK